jgi:hypothetical protein
MVMSASPVSALLPDVKGGRRQDDKRVLPAIGRDERAAEGREYELAEGAGSRCDAKGPGSLFGRHYAPEGRHYNAERGHGDADANQNACPHMEQQGRLRIGHGEGADRVDYGSRHEHPG